MWATSQLLDDGSTAYYDFDGTLLYVTPPEGVGPTGPVLPDKSILGDYGSQISQTLGAAIKNAFGGKPNGAPNAPAAQPGAVSLTPQMKQILMLAAGAALVVFVVKAMK